MILTGKSFIVWMVLYSPTQTEWAKYGKPNCHYGHELVKQKISSKLSLLKERIRISDITLLTKVCRVKAMVFPVVMDGCESWTIKKAEHRRINTFELWCYRRLLRVSWTSRRSNQSILKENSPEYSLEGLMLKLKFQYLTTWCEELTDWKSPWCWQILKAKGEGDDRGLASWRSSSTQWTWVWASSRRWWRTSWEGKPGMLQSMYSQTVSCSDD